MSPKSAKAFAPAAISNFFSLRLPRDRIGPETDLHSSGATGGGYILSEGVFSEATATPGEGNRLEIAVDGDPSYPATTTKTALDLLLRATRASFGRLSIDQRLGVRVGYGFGSSAASSLSAVFAASSALGLKMPKKDVAYFAHAAELIRGTGAGTVSVVYDSLGAGAITSPGAPGTAKFLRVKVPAGTRLVTAALGPMERGTALRSYTASERARKLGDEALSRVLDDPTLDTMGSAGEWFSERLGLMAPEAKALTETAKRAGAAHASQNMIGQAVHAVADEDRSERVRKSLAEVVGERSVGVYSLGRVKAGPLTLA